MSTHRKADIEAGIEEAVAIAEAIHSFSGADDHVSLPGHVSKDFCMYFHEQMYQV